MIRQEQDFNVLKMAFKAVTEYNNQFSMASGIIGLIEGVMRNDKDATIGSSPSFKYDQRPQFQDFLENHGVGLERLGIQPRQKVGEGAIMYGGADGEMKDAKIDLAIEDPGRFATALKSLDYAGYLNADLQDVFQALIAASVKLVHEEGIRRLQGDIKDGLPLIEDEKISALSDVVSEMQRFNLTEQLRPLQELLEAHEAGYLPEFALVRSSGALLQRNSGRFSPGEWITDMIPALYEKRWHQMCHSIVAKLAENPAAAKLLEKTVNNLLDCIAASREILDVTQYRYIRDHEQQYRDTLHKAEEYLKGLILISF